MKTKIKNASVKVMLSYDYSHFEVNMSLENDDELTLKDIDEARKKCQRLADKAVGQYRTAKEMAQKRVNGNLQMENFVSQCKRIELKAEGDRTINEIAMLKQYKTEKWQEQFEFYYNYDDDYVYGDGDSEEDDGYGDHTMNHCG